MFQLRPPWIDQALQDLKHTLPNNYIQFGIKCQAYFSVTLYLEVLSPQVLVGCSSNKKVIEKKHDA